MKTICVRAVVFVANVRGRTEFVSIVRESERCVRGSRKIHPKFNHTRGRNMVTIVITSLNHLE